MCIFTNVYTVSAHISSLKEHSQVLKLEDLLVFFVLSESKLVSWLDKTS